MRLEHARDSRRADPAFEPLDHALLLHERERRDGFHAEVLRQLRLLGDVHLCHAQTGALLASEVRDEAFHAPGRPGVGGSEEDEQRAGVRFHGDALSPAKRTPNRVPGGAVYTPGEMWEWYRIGLSLGLGIGVGGLLSALAAPRRALVLVVAALAAAAGAGAGYAIGGWHEAVAGGVGGVLGAIVVAAFVAGALRRGGTRGGTALLVALAALVLAALALVPAVGYLEAVVLPALAARARRHGGDRYAGLRTLARD